MSAGVIEVSQSGCSCYVFSGRMRLSQDFDEWVEFRGDIGSRFWDVFCFSPDPNSLT